MEIEKVHTGWRMTMRIGGTCSFVRIIASRSVDGWGEGVAFNEYNTLRVLFLSVQAPMRMTTSSETSVT